MRAYEKFLSGAVWLVAFLLCWKVSSQQEPPLVPAMFVFADSLSDNGNNNHIPSLARANFPPYGIDFPSGVTGRFCNGRILVDILANLLGLPFIPPYLDSSTHGRNVVRGVNYASAAGGILDESGKNYVARISFNQQIANFQNTLQVLNELAESREILSQYLSKSIFVIAFGSNDYLNNYLMPNLYSSSREYSPRAYAVLLPSEYSKQLTALYNLGARKFVIPSVGALGCIPEQLSMSNTVNGQCNETVNELLVPFNEGLLSLIRDLNAGLPGGSFIYLDTFKLVLDIIRNPAAKGFRVVNEGCCGFGKNKGQFTCFPLAKPCEDRNGYVFWDAYHPTEAVNVLLGRETYEGSNVYPINLRQHVLQ